MPGNCLAQPNNGKKKEHDDKGSSLGRALCSSSSTRFASPPWRPDDKDGHYVFELDENITPRYKILSKMGEGTFGRVLECWDRENQEFVAIKVIRNVRKYRAAAMIEIDVLRTLAKHDKTASRGCLQLKDWFDYRSHVCIVCEKLGPSLYDFLRKNNHRPFSVDLVREFARQILEAVAYMHDLTLTHTDLKPENILLVSSDHLKKPYKGDALFQTHENLEHLAMMEQVLGPLPQYLIKRASQWVGKYFRNGRELNWPEGAASRESIRAVRRLPRLRNLIMQNVDHSAGALIDLLHVLLKFDPNERVSAKEALKHHFFREKEPR